MKKALELEPYRILVVDDNTSDRMIAEAVLKTLGCRYVRSAPDGVAAISMLENAVSAKIPFDLALLDWQMPKSNGLKLLQNIRWNPALEKMPVIIMTANAEPLRVEGAIQNRVDEILVKPITEALLAAKIAKVLLRREPIEG
jgi:two-component system chemotaxis response regulator CheY